MHGVCLGNAGFTFGCFWPGAASAVVLAFLGLASFERWPTTLFTRPAAVGSAALTLNLSTSGQKVIFHNYNFMEFCLKTLPKSAAFKAHIGVPFRLEAIE